VKDYVEIIGDEFKLIGALLSGDSDKIEKAWATMCDHMGEFFNASMNVVQYEATRVVLKLTHLYEDFFDNITEKFERLAVRLAVGPFGDVSKYLGKSREERAAEAAEPGYFQPSREKYGFAPKSPAMNITPVLNSLKFIVDPFQAALRRSGGPGASSTHTSETHIETINVNAPLATDAPAISKAIGGSLKQMFGGLTEQSEGI